MAEVRVVLADDDVLLRERLASLLDRSGHVVLGQAGDSPGLSDPVRLHRPDLSVVDIRMPPDHSTEGLAAARGCSHCKRAPSGRPQLTTWLETHELGL
ncbi:response regulator [Streptomyces sp. NPDC020412]|uniref:response regulator n=1 Tax=Streptomyces sp. NPDC020412 TaxID=3365073 RepID=UPI0037A9306E